MFPWTTPPASWPAPPQPATPSPTWPSQSVPMAPTTRPTMTWPTTAPPSTSPPQSTFPVDPYQFSINPPTASGTTPTPVEHLFGQPSNLHSTWPPSTSLPTSPTTLPSPSFTSLASLSHTVPTPHLAPPPTHSMRSDTTTFHSAPTAFMNPTAPSVPTTWPTTPTSTSASTALPVPLPSSPYPPRAHQPPPLDTETPPIHPPAPRHTAVKAAPKMPSDKKLQKPRRSTPKAPSTPPTSTAPTQPPTPSPAISPELAALGTTTQQLAESVRLIHAQQQMLFDSHRLQEQRQHLLPQDRTQTTSSHPAQVPTPTPPTTTTPPAAKARPIEPPANEHNPRQPPAPIPIPSTSPTRRHRSRTRRSRSRRPPTHTDRRPPHLHSAKRPRSPLPRHRSSTTHLKDRRTPSPYRRRSPPRRRSTPRRRRSHHPRRSRSPRRHSRGHEVVLRPAARPSNPDLIPTPDADDSWGNWHNTNDYNDDPRHRDTRRPRSPPGPPPSDTASHSRAATTAPLGAVTFRVPDGDSETSDAAEAFCISQFDKNDIEVEEYLEAARDPLRTRCLTELGPDHSVSLRMELDQPAKILFNQFVDEMFTQLSKPYRTNNNEEIFIKASRATVVNIARAFAQANLLDISLAQKTQAFYVEPENLLTITVPTGLPKKPIYRGEHAGTYLSYHKTSWESVAKILAEDCIRPATWTSNEAGIPTQYPCYGFFGMSSEIADIDVLPAYSVKLCTSQLYKIGKGQNPSGLLAICRSPKCMRAQSGGNDQIQRLCALQGIAKGKDGATAMNSSCASICFVASTHSVFPGLITRPSQDTHTSTSMAPNIPPDDSAPTREVPVLPNTTADTTTNPNPPPSTHTTNDTIHDRYRHPIDHNPPDHYHSWNTSSWPSSAHPHRSNYSSYREGRSRDGHREGYSRARTHDSYRSQW